MAKRIAEMASLRFDYSILRTGKRRKDRFPCVRLCALYVFVLKLSLGLDSRIQNEPRPSWNINVDLFLDSFEKKLKKNMYYPTMPLEWLEFDQEKHVERYMEYWNKI
jgi:hypothetical protein